MAAPVPVRLAARSHARRAMCPEWSREPAQAVARKRSGPEGFLDDEERSRKEPRRVAELKEPRAGSGEHTFKAERTGRESAGVELRRSLRRRCVTQAGSLEGSGAE